jgi:hypothetical protein
MNETPQGLNSWAKPAIATSSSRIVDISTAPEATHQRLPRRSCRLDAQTH